MKDFPKMSFTEKPIEYFKWKKKLNTFLAQTKQPRDTHGPLNATIGIKTIGTLQNQN